MVEFGKTFSTLFRRRRHLLEDVRRLLLQKFYSGCKHVFFYKSGRSALSAVFEALAKEKPGAKVLVPDYICNVVPRAVTRANLKPAFYRTTDRFEPDFSNLLEGLADRSVAAVILASLFGSQNTSQAILDRIRKKRNDVLLVLDDCQNLLLDRAIMPDARTLVVFSFNMKTIAGAMGGGICFADNSLALTPPQGPWIRDLLLECAVVMVFFRQCLQWVWRKLQNRFGVLFYKPPVLEYSHAAGRIHYDMVPQRIATFSLVRALIQMDRAGETESIRKRNFERLLSFLQRTGGGNIVSTQLAASAAFLPIRSPKPEFLTRLPLKGPYALDRDPTRTLHPDLVCFRNDGLDCFLDLVD